MGCDIHCYAEFATEEDCGWKMVNWEMFTYYGKEKRRNPFKWRNYDMFSILAGVRNYGSITPISEPKGLPDDISRGVWYELYGWGNDAHSHSYLTLRELVEHDYDDEFIMTNSMFFKNIEELKTLGGLDDVRIVFWFDN